MANCRVLIFIKLSLGATVDLDEYEKENPRDFTLFKRSRLSELKRGIFFKTQWGNVRPSWHIQCAAMSMKYLGDNYDIYASSRELLFPHHENVNAIAAALTGRALGPFLDPLRPCFNKWEKSGRN